MATAKCQIFYVTESNWLSYVCDKLSVFCSYKVCLTNFELTNACRSSTSDDKMHEDTCNLRTLMFKNKSSHQVNSIDLFTCSLYGQGF